MLYQDFLHPATPGDIELKTILPSSQVRFEVSRSSPWHIRGSNCCTPSDGQARGEGELTPTIAIDMRVALRGLEALDGSRQS